MNRVVAIVEGQTEQTFVGDQLAAHLGARGTTISARLPGRRSGRSGGVRKWESAKEDIIRTLKEGCYCTTMFDFYALPNDWPGRKEAAQKDWTERGQHVESAVLDDVTKQMGNSFNPNQFIPYIQVHEFEALLFSDVLELAQTAAALSCKPVESLTQAFQNILTEAGNPEAINDNYETCPSRRIASHASAYRKALHGPIIAKNIGLDVLVSQCEHFRSWVERLERIGSQT